MPAPTVPNIATGAEQFSIDMRAFHSWEAGELWSAVDAFFNGRLISTTGTSTSSVLIGTGDKTFTTQAGLGYVTGMPVNVVNTANPANYMSGFVKSYSGTTLVVTVISIGGSGTLSAWSIALGLSGGGATLGSNTYSGAQNFNQASDIASAATVNLTTATGNAVIITGSTNITSGFTLANGHLRYGHFSGSLTITHNATTANLNNGGQNLTVSAGDRFIAYAEGGVVYFNVYKNSGLANQQYSKLESISASVATNALTVTINPTTLDFRSTTLTSGVPVTRTISSAISMTVSSGSTLGTSNNTAARLAILAIDNAGTVEVAIVNVAGGTQLDETNLINTTAEGGAGAADSASTIYSTTARTGVAYRVVGFIDITQATAGTWASAPTLVQGAGGNAAESFQSLGYGQSWQNMTASRAVTTVYTNTTGRTIAVKIIASTTAAGFCTATIQGLTMNMTYSGGAGNTSIGDFIIPPGGTYSLGPTLVSSFTWFELRS